MSESATPAGRPDQGAEPKALFTAGFISVIEAVLRERAYQDTLYPPELRSVGSHVLVMEQELLEARIEAVRGAKNRADALREILQVVACGVACLMQNGVCERRYTTDLIEKAARRGGRPAFTLSEADAALRAVAVKTLAGKCVLVSSDGYLNGELEDDRQHRITTTGRA